MTAFLSPGPALDTSATVQEAVAWSWPLKTVTKTRGCRYRVWLAAMPLKPLPGGGPVELRIHLKQWDGNAAEPYSWCLQETKYAAKSGGHMDPYKPFQLVQYSQRDWSGYLASKSPDIRATLGRELPRIMAAAPPIQASMPTAAAAAVAGKEVHP